MLRRLVLSSVLATANTVFAQAPAFDVASIRVSQSGDGMKHEGMPRDPIRVSPDAVSARNVTLRTITKWAYHVQEFQVTGPDWISSQRYDVTAKAAKEVPEEQLRLMMQALLAERFKMEVHRQNKEMQAYLLQVAKGGVKFKESTSDGEADVKPDQQKMQISVQRTGIQTLVDGLANMFRAPIIDQTGLTGKYDITINVAKYIAEFGPGSGRGAGDAPPDPFAIIIRGLQEELGLKLEPKKMAVDLVVIDRAEKVPVAN
jgi:uncharacterized protein (TIGR03435 family)